MTTTDAIRHAPRVSGRAPVLVIGLGNVLLGDDGLGVHAVQALKDLKLPDGVEVSGGDMMGADLLEAIADREKVVIVDAVQAEIEPGTVMGFTARDLALRGAEAMSQQQAGILEALCVARQLECAPREVVIIGVSPRTLGSGLALSAEIEALIPTVVDLVLAELGTTV